VKKIWQANSWHRWIIGLLSGSFLLFVSFVNLGSVPALWWDEGWTLLVAKNWVERGFYGRLIEGQIAAPGLQAAFPVITPIALSFRIFGIGVWQGRLPGVLFTLASLSLIYYLSRRLYSKPVAAGTLFVLVLMLVHPAINPIYNGRMVLADMPVVFYLLAGMVCLLFAGRRPFIILPLVCLFWGTAFITKLESIPFCIVAIFVVIGLSAIRRYWRTFGFFLAVMAGSLMVAGLWLFFQNLILQGHTLPQEFPSGMLQTMAVVLDPNVRLNALVSGLLYGLPTLLGLAYATWTFFKRFRQLVMDDPAQVVWVMMLWLAGSWFGWYFLFSNGGARYLASPSFLAGMFVSAMLYDATGQFHIRETWRRARNALKPQGITRSNLFALITIVLATPFIVASLLLFNGIWLGCDHSAEEVAITMNTQAPPGSLVETYDAELFFFLRQPYHFPPDQTHIEYLRRKLFDPALSIAYDPLEENPDFLIVGPISKDWGVYDPVIRNGDFRLVREYSRYKLYARVRN
jgi:4-amino-4-deoxy-L-arabinose transferase-like glycosyltransferase